MDQTIIDMDMRPTLLADENGETRIDMGQGQAGLAMALAIDAVKDKRLRTLATLRSSAARTALRAPVLDTTDIVVSAQTASSSFGAGTFTDFLVTNGSAGKFTFLGAAWAPGAAFPANQVYVPITRHAGNGTDPSVSPAQMPGNRVRFFTEAPKFELYVQVGNNQGGFRLLIDGKYAKAGLIGNSEDGNLRYVLVTIGDGTATYRKARMIELEFGSDGGFGGVRCEKIYAPRPAPQPDGLRLMVHGDSRVSTVVDTGTTETQLWGVMGQHLANLLGQGDVWLSLVGGTGWIAPQSPKNFSWFNDRLAIDVVAVAPDVIIETGGSNDQSRITAYGEAAYQALVATWIGTVVAAKPETVILMTGPMAAKGAENTDANWLKVRNAKQAAAALYPKNVVFIDNLAEAWASGSGKQTATANDGQADWTVGSDGAHNTIAGNWWYADRIARAVAGAIPALIAANSI